MVTQVLSELGASAGTTLGAWERMRTGTSAWSYSNTVGQPQVLSMARIYFQII